MSLNPGPSGMADSKENEAETEAYSRKLAEMKKYLPFLERMINSLESMGETNRESQLKKMKSLHSILVDPQKRLKLETLIKCEEVLTKIHSKVEPSSMQSAEKHKQRGSSICTDHVVIPEPESPPPSAIAESYRLSEDLGDSEVTPRSPSPDGWEKEEVIRDTWSKHSDNPVVIPMERKVTEEMLQVFEGVLSKDKNNQATQYMFEQSRNRLKDLRVSGDTNRSDSGASSPIIVLPMSIQLNTSSTSTPNTNEPIGFNSARERLRKVMGVGLQGLGVGSSTVQDEWRSPDARPRNIQLGRPSVPPSLNLVPSNNPHNVVQQHIPSQGQHSPSVQNIPTQNPNMQPHMQPQHDMPQHLRNSNRPQHPNMSPQYPNMPQHPPQHPSMSPQYPNMPQHPPQRPNMPYHPNIPHQSSNMQPGYQNMPQRSNMMPQWSNVPQQNPSIQNHPHIPQPCMQPQQNILPLHSPVSQQNHPPSNNMIQQQPNSFQGHILQNSVPSQPQQIPTAYTNVQNIQVPPVTTIGNLMPHFAQSIWVKPGTITPVLLGPIPSYTGVPAPEKMPEPLPPWQDANIEPEYLKRILTCANSGYVKKASENTGDRNSPNSNLLSTETHKSNSPIINSDSPVKEITTDENNDHEDMSIETSSSPDLEIVNEDASFLFTAGTKTGPKVLDDHQEFIQNIRSKLQKDIEILHPCGVKGVATITPEKKKRNNSQDSHSGKEVTTQVEASKEIADKSNKYEDLERRSKTKIKITLKNMPAKTTLKEHTKDSTPSSNTDKVEKNIEVIQNYVPVRTDNSGPSTTDQIVHHADSVSNVPNKVHRDPWTEFPSSLPNSVHRDPRTEHPTSMVDTVRRDSQSDTVASVSQSLHRDPRSEPIPVILDSGHRDPRTLKPTVVGDVRPIQSLLSPVYKPIPSVISGNAIDVYTPSQDELIPPKPPIPVHHVIPQRNGPRFATFVSQVKPGPMSYQPGMANARFPVVDPHAQRFQSNTVSPQNSFGLRPSDSVGALRYSNQTPLTPRYPDQTPPTPRYSDHAPGTPRYLDAPGTPRYLDDPGTLIHEEPQELLPVMHRPHQQPQLGGRMSLAPTPLRMPGPQGMQHPGIRPLLQDGLPRNMVRYQGPRPNARYPYHSQGRQREDECRNYKEWKERNRERNPQNRGRGVRNAGRFSNFTRRDEVQREGPKPPEELASPLDKLYSNVKVNIKTGKGYGLQNFKIPKKNTAQPKVPDKRHIAEQRNDSNVNDNVAPNEESRDTCDEHRERRPSADKQSEKDGCGERKHNVDKRNQKDDECSERSHDVDKQSEKDNARKSSVQQTEDSDDRRRKSRDKLDSSKGKRDKGHSDKYDGHRSRRQTRRSRIISSDDSAERSDTREENFGKTEERRTRKGSSRDSSLEDKEKKLTRTDEEVSAVSVTEISQESNEIQLVEISEDNQDTQKLSTSETNIEPEATSKRSDEEFTKEFFSRFVVGKVYTENPDTFLKKLTETLKSLCSEKGDNIDTGQDEEVDKIEKNEKREESEKNEVAEEETVNEEAGENNKKKQTAEKEEIVDVPPNVDPPTVDGPKLDKNEDGPENKNSNTYDCSTSSCEGLSSGKFKHIQTKSKTIQKKFRKKFQKKKYLNCRVINDQESETSKEDSASSLPTEDNIPRESKTDEIEHSTRRILRSLKQNIGKPSASPMQVDDNVSEPEHVVAYRKKDSDTEESNLSKMKPRRKKGLSELDKLHENLKEVGYEDSELMSCRRRKPADTASTPSVTGSTEEIKKSPSEKSDSSASMKQIKVVLDKISAKSLEKPEDENENSLDGDMSVGGCDSDTSVVTEKSSGSKTEPATTTDVTPAVSPTNKRSTKVKRGTKGRRSNKWSHGITNTPKQKPKSVGKGSSSQLTYPESHDLSNLPFYVKHGSLFNCHLCNYNCKKPVLHYVTAHPNSEVGVSRLNSQNINSYVLTHEELKQLKEKPEPKNYVCIFCNNNSDAFENFYEHVTSHTGEYRYKCVFCSFRNSQSHTLNVHNRSSHRKEDSNAMEIEPLLQELPVLVGHTCAMCSYVQLSEESILKHVELAHPNADGEVMLLINMNTAVVEEEVLYEKVETVRVEPSVFEMVRDLTNEEYDIECERQLVVNDLYQRFCDKAKPIIASDFLERFTKINVNETQQCVEDMDVDKPNNEERAIDNKSTSKSNTDSVSQHEMSRASKVTEDCTSQVTEGCVSQVTEDCATPVMGNNSQQSLASVMTSPPCSDDADSTSDAESCSQDSEQLLEPLDLDTIAKGDKSAVNKNVVKVVQLLVAFLRNVKLKYELEMKRIKELPPLREEESREDLLSIVTCYVTGCLQYFESKDKFLLHISNEHGPSETAGHCRICSVELPHYLDSYEHFSTVHDPWVLLEAKRSTKDTIKCFAVGCTFYASNYAEFQGHMKDHDEEICAQCSLCGRNMQGQTQIIEHFNEEHKESLPKKFFVTKIRVRNDLMPAADDDTTEIESEANNMWNSPDDADGSCLLMISNVVSLAPEAANDNNAMENKSDNELACARCREWPKSPELKCPEPKQWPSVFIKRFKTPAIYSTMLSVNTIRHLFKCMKRDCSFSSDIRENFIDHLEIHRLNYISAIDKETDWLHCAFCAELQTDIRRLLNHIITWHGLCKFQCRYCFYRCVSDTYGLVHMDQCHPNERSEHFPLTPLYFVKDREEPSYNNSEVVLKYQCSECAYESITGNCFMAHLRLEHSDMSFFSCSICTAIASSPEFLLEHCKHHDMDLYQCSCCRYGDGSYDSLLLHQCLTHPHRMGKVLIRGNMPGEISTNLRKANWKVTKRAVIPPCNDTSASPQVNGIALHADNETTQPGSITDHQNQMETTQVLDTDVMAKKKLQPVPPKTLIQPVLTENIPQPLLAESLSQPMETDDLSESEQEDMDPIYDIFEIPPPSPIEMPDVFMFPTQTLLKVAQECAELRKQQMEENKENLRYTDNSVKENRATPSEVIVLDSNDDNNVLPRTTNYVVGDLGLFGSDLYICGNPSCDFSADTPTLLRDHLSVCDFSRGLTHFPCYHCGRGFKQMIGILDHLKSHGRKNIMCSMCTHRATSVPAVQRHMKSDHKVVTYKTQLLDPNVDSEEGDFVILPKCKGNKKKDKKDKTGSYLPSEVNNIPRQSVLRAAARCAMCSYSSKVRSNIVKHLYLHELNKTAPNKAPTNPMPCLERKELMFDKMTNWAGSSQEAEMHTHNKITASNQQIEEASSELLRYIPELTRYACGACEYTSSSNELLFKTHLDTLHKDYTSFKCLHCANIVCPSVDSFKTHNALHGPTLYKCVVCQYHSDQKNSVERHVREKHPDYGMSPYSIEIRNIQDNETPQAFGDGVRQPWRCGICKSSASTEDGILIHVQMNHGVRARYKCALCPEIEMDSDDEKFDLHFVNMHPKLPIRVITLYYKIDDDIDDQKDATISTLPLWRRNDPNRILHFRGILCEVVELEHSDELDDDQDVDQDVDQDDNQDIMKRFLPINKEKEKERFGPIGQATGDFFCCPKCNKFRTKDIEELKLHIYKELKYGRFVCTHCGKTNAAHDALVQHSARFHDGKPESILPMTPDGILEEWLDQVIATQSEHIMATTADINKGNEVVDDPEPMTIELKKNEAIGVKSDNLSVSGGNEADIFSMTKDIDSNGCGCSMCGVQLRTILGLKLHVKSKHLNMKLWLCKLCDTVFSNVYLLRLHHKKVHPLQEESFEKKSESDQKVLPNDYWVKFYKASTKRKEESGSDLPDAKKMKATVEVSSSAETTNPSSVESSPQKSIKKRKLQSLSPGKVCPYCPCIIKTDINRHLQVHYQTSPYKCGHCVFISKQKSETIEHCKMTHIGLEVLVVDKSVPMQQVVGDITQDNQEVQKTTKVKTKNYRIKCGQCPHIVEKCAELKKHFELCHKGIPVQFRRVPLQTPFLAESPMSGDNTVMSPLKKKRVVADIDKKRQRPWKCDWCEEQYATENSFAEHHIKTHPHREMQAFDPPAGNELAGIDSNKLYHCPRCPYNTPRYTCLEFHIRRHAPPCKCSVCDSAFKFPFLLKQHFEKEHSDKTWETNTNFMHLHELKSQIRVSFTNYKVAKVSRQVARKSTTQCPKHIQPQGYSFYNKVVPEINLHEISIWTKYKGASVKLSASRFVAEHCKRPQLKLAHVTSSFVHT